MTAIVEPSLRAEVEKRRTFAIISHPDAGKTTLTEKFLLYGGAVEEAGSVRARRNARRSTSDWMAMEQQRGISVTSTALQFEAFGATFNLLDTPGHQDFSEDTYRTLTAADSAVMVLDAARGVEPQTKKLFAVCRARGVPVVTFVNKMDHPALDPLELLDEIERTLGMAAVPYTWPIGDGPSFQGVYDLRNAAVLLFERTQGGRHRAPVRVGDLDSQELRTMVGDQAHDAIREQIELVRMTQPEFDREAFLRGELSPVFFGSALNNFGVEPFLGELRDLLPPPGAYTSSRGDIDPADETFTGFVFKIQANMDPQHRDCMAFLRICSGRFEKGMGVLHPRSGKRIRLSRPHRLFARDRETVEEAYAGDVIGLVNPGMFAIGDAVTSGPALEFDAIPRFEPECFAILENRDVSRLKQFQRGLRQLEEEGATQVLYRRGLSRSEPVLAAVGELQFDVVVARLREEYGVETNLRRLPHTVMRLVRLEGKPLENAWWPQSAMVATDRNDDPVVILDGEWQEDFCRRNNAGLELERVGVGAG